MNIKRSMKWSFMCVLSLLFLNACEEVPVVIPEFQSIDTRKVLLVEDLTGVDCPNCPSGAAILEAAAKRYEGNVIIVGIHGIQQATPLEGKSKYDFRNQFAIDLEEYLKPFIGKPAAHFNRIQYEEIEPFYGNAIRNTWDSYIENELLKPQVMDLEIDHTYDALTREIDITIRSASLTDLTGEFNLSIMLTEGHIVDYQKGETEIIPEYEHNHVLMDMITRFDGDFVTNSYAANQVVETSYTYTLPTSAQGLMIPENMEIIAAIANVEGDSKEVLQAATVHLVE